MHPRQWWFRCAVAVVLPCSLLGGPTVSLVWGARLCPMRAMHHQPGPCFCDHMTAGTSMDLVSPVVLPGAVEVRLVADLMTARQPLAIVTRHDSPAHPPERPPPKAIA